MFTTQELEQIKIQLEENKTKLESELASISERSPQKGGNPQAIYPENGGNSDDDNAEEITNYADEVSLIGELQGQLDDVIKALIALEKGKYGTCKYCGKEIDRKRLEARPSSSSCIACKKTLTQEM
jgi:RNA polymerase-binding transcription factor DksA